MSEDDFRPMPQESGYPGLNKGIVFLREQVHQVESKAPNTILGNLVVSLGRGLTDLLRFHGGVWYDDIEESKGKINTLEDEVRELKGKIEELLRTPEKPAREESIDFRSLFVAELQAWLDICEDPGKPRSAKMLHEETGSTMEPNIFGQHLAMYADKGGATAEIQGVQRNGKPMKVYSF